MFSKFYKSFSKAPIWFRLGWILVGVSILLLRFWNIADMAWGYDELSAVFRSMQNPNWHDHLAHGVVVDGHPAGLQTALWLWISLAGDGVLIPRIFTAIFSVLVLLQFHGMAKRHFGVEAAYWGVCLMGLMWWQASMALWIRPYVFGLPFVLGSWDLVLGTLKNRDSQGEVVLPERMGWFAVKLGGALAGAAYIHYFAGLTAGASFIALLLIQPKIPKNTRPHTQGIHPSYILFLPITIAFVLYLPHLPITFAQFQLGGLNWLNQPTPSFLLDFLCYATGHSTVLLSALILLIVYNLQFQFRIAFLPKPPALKRILRQPSILLTFGFLLVFAFGYVYSVARAPILQNNALYFAFPLLMLVASEGLTTLRKQLGSTQNGTNRFERATQPLAIIVPLALLFNTLYQKQFFTIERKGCHHRIVEQSIAFAHNQISLQQSTEKRNPWQIWLDGPADNYQFHRRQILYKHNPTTIPPTIYFETQGPTLSFIAKKLQTLKPNEQVFFGVQSGSQPWLLPLVESHFAHTSRYENDPISEELNIDRELSPKNPPSQEQLIGGEWFTLTNYREPSFGPYDFHLQNADILHNTSDTTEFSIELPLKLFIAEPNDILLIVVKTEDATGEIQTSLWNPRTPSKHDFTKEIVQTARQIDWRSTHIKDYSDAGFKYALHAIKLADIPEWNSKTAIKIHINNASKILIGTYHGNPYLYEVSPD